MYKLEIACFNLESALITAKSAADRIEFCSDLLAGGTTPKIEDIKILKEHSSQAIRIMIRPRGGNFCYSKDEFEEMKSAIKTIKALDVEGFVFGILNSDQTIDIKRNKELVDLAYPYPCAFHRAFDRTQNLNESLEQIIYLGFKTLLTSGMSQNVDSGITRLKELVRLANNRIEIMPGGGLRSTNISKIKIETNATYYHSSALLNNSEIANLEEINRLKKLIN